jgi:hypothetical protein
VQLDVDDASRKSRVISQISLVDGVVQLLDFHGTSLRVIAYFEDDSAFTRKVELLKSICHHQGDVPTRPGRFRLRLGHRYLHTYTGGRQSLGSQPVTKRA